MDSPNSSSSADYSARGVYVTFALESGAVCDEPEDFAIHIHGEVMIPFDSVDDDVEYIKAGDVTATLFRLDAGRDAGCSLEEVLDADSEESAECLAFFGRGEVKTRVADMFDLRWVGSVLLVERIEIHHEHRGHDLGLLAMRATVNAFAGNETLVVCKPFPLQFMGNVTSEKEKDFRKALQKLRKYWARAGFRRLPGSELFGLSLTQALPAIEEMLGRS